ncbi:MAG: urease accessory UreF family protein [Pseudomonadota bacterium]
MIDQTLRLMAWLSPAYPVGAYTYSHGLEQAISAGDIENAATAQDWIKDCLSFGGGRADAIALSHAWRVAEEPAALQNLIDHVEAFAPSAERLLETSAQGTAFADVTAAAWADEACKVAPYPIALGAAAGRAGIDLTLATTLFLQAFVANLVSAAVRLVPLGQTEGQGIIAALSAVCETVAAEAIEADFEDIGGCAIRADIASMRHETQTVRLFRS